MTNSEQPKTRTWRDVLPIHPAAELFPLMSGDELRELGEDIKRRGLLEQPVFYRDPKLGVCVLDGRNRLDACELIGRSILDANNELARHWHIRDAAGSFDPVAFVCSKNLHRRHLTSEQKRDLIARVLKAKPEESNRQIAKQVKADHKTVSQERDKLESTGEIPQLEKTTGADGKSRKAARPPKAKKSKSLSAKPVTTRPVEIGARLCVELVAHVVAKTDPYELASRLRKSLKAEQIGALFKFLDQVRDSHTRATTPSLVAQQVGAAS